ncbi:hypothetical protein D3C86_1280980 [compost metagenome]
MASAPCGVAREQRRQDRLPGVHAGEHVHGRDAELQRPLPGLAVGGHHAGFALYHEVVARTLGFRREACVAGDRAVHKARIVRAELFVAQAQLFSATDLEVLDHHVAARGQLARQLHALFALQVQGDRALVAVGAIEIGGIARADPYAPVAGVVAPLGVLDLDDVGAEVRQGHRTHRPRQYAREVENAHACQRQRRGLIL